MIKQSKETVAYLLMYSSRDSMQCLTHSLIFFFDFKKPHLYTTELNTRSYTILSKEKNRSNGKNLSILPHLHQSFGQ